jgi:hypothetical protein
VATASMNLLSPSACDVLTASIAPPSSRRTPQRLGLARFNAHRHPPRPPQTPAAWSKRLYRKCPGGQRPGSKRASARRVTPDRVLPSIAGNATLQAHALI